MARRVTLKEVAVLAGVSYQTVSKVLNQKVQVSKETERRIFQAVESLGYRPNQLARSMRSQRSCLIGYSWAPTSPDQVNPILDQFLQSMAHAAESAGYHLLTFPYRKGEKWVDAYRDLVDTNRVDGFVVSSVEFDDSRIRFLQERSFPFVAFGRSNPDWDFPYVDVDGEAGMRMVAEHLLERGCRRIAVLAWPESSRVGQNRLQGLLSGFEKASLPAEQISIRRGEGNFQFGLECSRTWLELPKVQQPDAIVAFNDLMATGAMQAAQEKGLQIGRDLAVTGFDDVPMVQYLSPPLTSVRQPLWEVGQQVMSILLKLLDGVPVDDARLLLQPRLVVRESSGGQMLHPNNSAARR
jgi:DNA-binding LacI/PurR family transcriptional regulator